MAESSGSMMDLDEGNEDDTVNALDKDGATPLHYAVHGSDVAVLQQLLNHGANVNAVDSEGVTPLHKAACCNHVDVIHLLLKHGADVNAVDNQGSTPLHRAAGYNHVAILELLFNHGAYVNAVDNDSLTFFDWASAAEGHVDVLQLLLNHAADVNAVDNQGFTPLHVAARYNHHVDVIQLLLDHGANVNAVDSEGVTPLHKAAGDDECDVDIIQLLLNRGANVNAVDSEGVTPLHKAAGYYHVDVIHLLLNRGANVNAVTNLGNTPLHRAAYEGHVECIKLLLKSGANIKARNNHGKTPYQTAIEGKHKESAECLRNAGNKEDTVYSVDNGGDTSLHIAALRGDVDILQLVLNHGANVNVVNKNGFTPLHYAALEGHVECIKLLMKFGANIKARDNNGKTPYQTAIEGKHKKSAECLRNADNEEDTVNSVDNDGDTSLHIAAGEGDVDILQLVLNHGANVNVMNENGFTPLHYAALEGHVECIKLLLKFGANIKARNKDGKTPYQTAIECEHKESAECLRNADDEEDEELTNSPEDDEKDEQPMDSPKEDKENEDEEYGRAYSIALEEGEAKNNRIPIMLIGQDRGGKTSLMGRLLGLPFNKDQPSTIGIDVNVIELTEQNADDPWVKRQEKEFMTNESEAENMKYKKAAEYLDDRDREVSRNSGEDAPEPLKSVMSGTPVIAEKEVMQINPSPVKQLSRKEISKIKSQRYTQHYQKDVLRVFVTDFAGQSIYYDTHGCFVKPHCPYVLVHDLSLEFDKPAVPRFKASEKEEEEEINNPSGTTNLDYFTSWLKFLQGLGKYQDRRLFRKSGHCVTAEGEKFELPPVLIALTHSDKVKGEDSKIVRVQKRIDKILFAGNYTNVFREFFLINNTLVGDEGDDIRKLRRKLFNLSKAVLEQEILMPINWLDFEAALSKKVSPDLKFMPVDEAKKEAKDCSVREFDQAVKFLHSLGAVVYHSGSREVVLDPPWLMNLFTKVISIPSKVDPFSAPSLDMLKKRGILLKEYPMNKVLEDTELLEKLMEKFNLISRFQYKEKTAFYVPSVAPFMKQGEELEDSTIPSLFVTFPRQLVPIGLFTKLQVKLLSKYKESLPNQQHPSFYCNYSLLPLIIDRDLYDVCLLDLHEYIKIIVCPKQDGNHSKFASNFLAILKMCLNDLESPDQLLFGMTNYDLAVKCTCCFGKEESECSRHDKTQCDSDRCGHRHFWKLSELQKSYNDGSLVVCQSNKLSSKVFDIKSVEIWLNAVSDAPMEVEISFKFGQPDENSSATSSSECDNSKSATLNKRLHMLSMDDTTDSQEPQEKRKKSPLPVNMCKNCEAKKETPLPSDRSEWPISKIQLSYFYAICNLLDLTDDSNKPLMSALGGFDQTTAKYIEKKYKEKGGMGVAKEVLDKWGQRDKENTVGVLKKILKDIMQRGDVLDVIEKWEKMCVCHGCGIGLNPQ